MKQESEIRQIVRDKAEAVKKMAIMKRLNEGNIRWEQVARREDGRKY